MTLHDLVGPSLNPKHIGELIRSSMDELKRPRDPGASRHERGTLSWSTARRACPRTSPPARGLHYGFAFCELSETEISACVQGMGRR